MGNMYMDGGYLECNPTWHAEDSPWKSANILKMILRNRLDPKLVCEVGCGAGEILNQLSLKLDPGVEFHGYEISRQAYEICSAKSKSNLKFFMGDFTNIEIDRPYDLILAIDIIEHIEDYYGFLRTIRSRGKYKLFHIPLDLSVLSVFRVVPLADVRKQCGHIHYFTREMALSALTDAGYTIVDSFFTHRSIELEPKFLKTRLARLPRKLLFSINEDFGIRLLGGGSLMVLAT